MELELSSIVYIYIYIYIYIHYTAQFKFHILYIIPKSLEQLPKVMVPL